jgi:glucosyl-3-phosphoglycerate synthase
VVVPAREVAATIVPTVAALRRFVDAGAIDELLVVDAASRDGTAAAARAAGATVVQEDELMPACGPCRGKGDAMWRALAATTGEIVAYVDADSEDFGERMLTGLLAPLFERTDLALVKGAFERPFASGGRVQPGEGGRVTELMARPLLNLHRPALAGFAQPLAGEIAARRELLEALAFPVGYGVEIAMLLDAEERVGVGALAQADLGSRQNRHQPLRELSAMSYAVLVAASRRLLGEASVDALAPGPYALPGAEDLDVRQVAVDERPPMAGYAASASGSKP